MCWSIVSDVEWVLIVRASGGKVVVKSWLGGEGDRRPAPLLLKQKWLYKVIERCFNFFVWYFSCGPRHAQPQAAVREHRVILNRISNAIKIFTMENKSTLVHFFAIHTIFSSSMAWISQGSVRRNIVSGDNFFFCVFFSDDVSRQQRFLLRDIFFASVSRHAPHNGHKSAP